MATKLEEYAKYGICIRGHDPPTEKCKEHICAGCGKEFVCHQSPKHVCTPRPERMPTGIVRTPCEGERLSDGFDLLNKYDTWFDD